MKVLVDTSIWSLSLRRRNGGQAAPAAELASLVEDGRVAMIGAIRQELLSGIKERTQFDRLRDHLSAFPDTEIISADYEEAAAFFNRCRAKGIHASNIDFLICAVAVRNEYAIFTSDGDFAQFAKVLPIVLYT
ncbi:MAG TPA: PIN domain-containing protein [Thermoanaerobaculia bacterium]|jgi:predicted nucleic acid-binding protein